MYSFILFITLSKVMTQRCVYARRGLGSRPILIGEGREVYINNTMIRWVAYNYFNQN